MDIKTQSTNTYIALGILAGLGVIIAFVQTWKWFLRSGKEITDISVRKKPSEITPINFSFYRPSANLFSTFSVPLALQYYW